jgi:hypothetical protein
MEAFKHGTRARYVAGCRCRPCTYANTESVKKRDAEAKKAAAALGPRTETHCVGAEGEPCPKGTKLRKDSTGNYCAKCRLKLEWNGLVPANHARRHMRWLSKQGVGYKSIAATTDLAESTLFEILKGKRTQIRSETAQLILDVDTSAIADHALVDAAGAWAAISRLMQFHGYTKARISKEIGQGGRALQLGKKKILAKTAMKIQRLIDDADGVNLRG